MSRITSPDEINTLNLFGEIPYYLKDLMLSAKHPWQILPMIGDYIKSIYNKCLQDGYFEYSDGVLIGQGTTVADHAVICAPAIIGKDCDIRPGAYFRGNVITGSGCVIGNSSEIKNSVILNFAQLPHYNYVGDSIIGNYAHMGAGAVCSNLKGDKSLVTVKTTPSIATDLKKFGAVLADNTEVGCGCVLNPGTVICKNTRIYPLTSVRGVIPSDSIMKSSTQIVPIV